MKKQNSIKTVKDFNLWTRKEFEALPKRKFYEDIGEFDSLVILPKRDVHDSGFRCMDFVAIRGAEPICRLIGCSDVIRIDGIGGYGKLQTKTSLPELLPPKGWRIDCLKKSGLIRIFSHYKLSAGCALSSFDLYANEK